MTLLVVIASTRPGRVGLPVGKWFVEQAQKHGGFDEVAVADLMELSLPLLDEPQHPRLRKYTKDHTVRWSRMVDAADAVVFVMPEYNYSMTAPLINAVDFLYSEWNYKAAGLVSYGGISGGLRAQQQAKQVLTAVRMMPVPESVSIPFVAQYLKDGKLDPPEAAAQSAQAMLDELRKWTTALLSLRVRQA